MSHVKGETGKKGKIKAAPDTVDREKESWKTIDHLPLISAKYVLVYANNFRLYLNDYDLMNKMLCQKIMRNKTKYIKLLNYFDSNVCVHV